MTDGRWLLLIHQTPPKPDYLRVKVRRRLRDVGAVAIKNSVYALPASETAMEDFQWILREIVGAGGDASICRAGFVDGLTDAQVQELFEQERKADYETLLADVQALREELNDAEPDRRSAELQLRLATLTRRRDALARIDYFGAAQRHAVTAAIREVHDWFRPPSPATESRSQAAVMPRGSTWVTRTGIKVDRIGCAWLIRRFLDPEAVFRFVDAERYEHRPGELRFDMFEGEFTHKGDLCTFEVLLQRFLPGNLALRRIADSVHDLDVKDGRYDHAETPGIGYLIEGIAAAHAGDEARLRVGAELFDVLYARSGSLPPEVSGRRNRQAPAGGEPSRSRSAGTNKKRRQR